VTPVQIATASCRREVTRFGRYKTLGIRSGRALSYRLGGFGFSEFVQVFLWQFEEVEGVQFGGDPKSLTGMPNRLTQLPALPLVGGLEGKPLLVCQRCPEGWCLIAHRLRGIESLELQAFFSNEFAVGLSGSGLRALVLR
jgi:hypothetical protein